MSRKRTFVAFSLSILILVLGSISVGAQRSLHFLAVGYSPALIQALEERILPEFKRRHNVEVILENTTWEQRIDRFVVQLAGGVPPDLVTTGYYSAYEEGAAGLLMPLDKFLSSWQFTDYIPGPIWESQQWEGTTYAMPMEVDVRGIVFSKQVFEGAGFDPSNTPKSWEELAQFTRRLTTLSSDQQSVATRGMWMDPLAQNLFWFMMQAGVSPVDLATMTPNFDKPEAMAAADILLELNQAAEASLPGPRSDGVLYGETGMGWFHPGWFNNALASTGQSDSVVQEIGVFSPQYSAADAPVSIGFINGLAIPQGSQNPDLAWELITYLTSEEVLSDIYKVTGWVSPRMDIVPELMLWPGVDMFYALLPNIQTTIVPPPRNRAQSQVDQLMRAMTSMQITPATALINANRLWMQLLDEWQGATQ